MHRRHRPVVKQHSPSRTAKKRNRRARVAAVAALLLVLSASLSVATFGGIEAATAVASAAATAAVQHAKSFIQLMQQRSPGKRTTAHLAQLKHKRVASRVALPKVPLHERALAKVRPPLPLPPLTIPPALVDLVAPPLPALPASFEVASIPPLEQTTLPPGSPLFPPPGVILPPIVPTETPIPPPVITPSAVPEPTTWMMMLLGFSLLGWRVCLATRTGALRSNWR